MIIKKFLAKTETEAIEMAKQELGNAAIVMNIKKVRPKGLAKLFIHGKVEVTAALDEAPVQTEKVSESAASDVSRPKPSKEPELDVAKNIGEDDSLEERLTRLQALLERQMSEKKEEEKSGETIANQEQKTEETTEIEEAAPVDEEKEKEIEYAKNCKTENIKIVTGDNCWLLGGLAGHSGTRKVRYKILHSFRIYRFRR